MVKAGLFGAIALFLGSSLAFAAENGAAFAPNVAAKYETVMSSAHVARLKAVLKLTADQEPHWPAIDRAFREISQSQAASPGFVQGIKQRVAQVALNSLALRRLATAAQPLIRTLSDEQKQNALQFARSMGLHSVALAF